MRKVILLAAIVLMVVPCLAHEHGHPFVDPPPPIPEWQLNLLEYIRVYSEQNDWNVPPVGPSYVGRTDINSPAYVWYWEPRSETILPGGGPYSRRGAQVRKWNHREQRWYIAKNPNGYMAQLSLVIGTRKQLQSGRWYCFPLA